MPERTTSGLADPLRVLAEAAGAWTGESRLWLDPAAVPQRSATTLRMYAVLGGRFVRLDYDWSWEAEPQEGSLLLGYDAARELAVASWIDSWHMGDAIMQCAGAAEGHALDVRGEYAVPGGPPWGWRIRVEPAADRLRLLMWNVTPDGEEQRAVEAEYHPAT